MLLDAKNNCKFFQIFSTTSFLKMNKNEKHKNPHYIPNMAARGLKF